MVCLLAVQWVHAVSGIGGAAAAAFFGRWTYDAIVILAGVSLLTRGAGARSARGTWLLLGVGLLSKAVGDVIYSLAGDLAAVPVPSVSDPFWLAIYPCAYLALLLLVRDRVRTALAATRLDGVICGVTVAAALACITLPAAFSAGAGASFWEQATDLAYPAGDLVLIGAIVSAIALSGWRIDRTLGTLGLAILVWETADLMYMFSVTGTGGNIADALVLTGVAGMALAAIYDRPAIADEDVAERGLFVPVAFGAVALVILIGGAVLRLEVSGLCLAALALALVLIRMKLALSENRALLHQSTVQARTDPLTELGNRRQLTRDLTRLAHETGGARTLAVVMLDLNGFKAYNDTFGHAAGDALLVQLAASLKAAVNGRGNVYRLGGDEFCVLAPCDTHETAPLSALCQGALAARGDGFSISAAHGLALVPTEARDTSDALALADARMYANKFPGPLPAMRAS
jgi:diguanylate cyclase (GGDEF)-like protein